MDARSFLLRRIYEILRPLNLCDDDGRPPLARAIFFMLVEDETLIKVGVDWDVVVDPITSIERFLRGPQIDELTFNLPDSVSPLAEDDKVD